MARALSAKLKPVPPARKGAPERIVAILDAADRVLHRLPVVDLKLADVSAEAGISKATIYHFFPSTEALLVGLLRRYFEGMDVAIAHQLVTAPSVPWQALIRILFEEARAFYVGNPICAELVFHTGGYGGLQTADADHIDEWAGFACRAFAKRYYLPEIPHMARRVAIGLAISDRIWAMDIHKGCVSDFMFEESQRAVVAYLANFLPPMMAMRE